MYGVFSILKYTKGYFRRSHCLFHKHKASCLWLGLQWWSNKYQYECLVFWLKDIILEVKHVGILTKCLQNMRYLTPINIHFINTQSRHYYCILWYFHFNLLVVSWTVQMSNSSFSSDSVHVHTYISLENLVSFAQFLFTIGSKGIHIFV